MCFWVYDSYNLARLNIVSENRFYALLNQRIPLSLDLGLRYEAEARDETLAVIIRDCLYIGLTELQRTRLKAAKKEPPQQLVNSR